MFGFGSALALDILEDPVLVLVSTTVPVSGAETGALGSVGTETTLEGGCELGSVDRGGTAGMVGLEAEADDEVLGSGGGGFRLEWSCSTSDRFASVYSGG